MPDNVLAINLDNVGINLDNVAMNLSPSVYTPQT